MEYRPLSEEETRQLEFNNCWAENWENVTVSKQRKVADAALRYLNTAKDKRIPPDAEVNFDIVAVTFGGGKEIVEWFPNAFYPMYL